MPQNPHDATRPRMDAPTDRWAERASNFVPAGVRRSDNSRRSWPVASTRPRRSAARTGGRNVDDPRARSSARCPDAVGAARWCVVVDGAGAGAGAGPVRPSASYTMPTCKPPQRLFTAWLEGQMLYRHLPGVAVGVVADQDLVWSAGFGFADTAAKVADDAADEVPHGVAQQALHRHRGHAAARAGQAASRRSGVEVPAVVRACKRRPIPTIRRSRSRSCSPTARGCRARPDRTGRRSTSRPPSSCAG